MQVKHGFLFAWLFIVAVASGFLVFQPIEGNARLGSLLLIDTPLEIPATNEKVRILIVPGHTNAEPGARFQDYTENELTLAIARSLEYHLASDSGFEVILARNPETGFYTPELTEYLSKKDAIQSFRIGVKNLAEKLFAMHIFERRVHTVRNNEVAESALELYGINKWANEHHIDLVLHMHVNDHPRANQDLPGMYMGYVVFIPDAQFVNASSSRHVGSTVSTELSRMISASSHPLERSGLVEEQELIAIGAHLSRNDAAVLVEYGYIYEPQFMNRAVRSMYTEELGLRTYRALKKAYQGVEVPLPVRSHTIVGKSFPATEIFQAELSLLDKGFFPSPRKTLTQCRVDGVYDDCLGPALAGEYVSRSTSSESISVTGAATAASE